MPNESTKLATKSDLAEFYKRIYPYLGGGGGGGSSQTAQMIAPIESTSTASQAYAVGKQLVYNGLLYTVDVAISQGDTLTPGTNISLSPDVTDQIEAVINDVMTSSDMNDVVTPLPGTKPAKENYSTGEQLVGTWIDDKPVYQRTLTGSLPSSFSGDEIVGTIANISEFISGIGSIKLDNSLYQMTVPFVNIDTAAGLYKDGNYIRISLTNKSRFFGQSYAITIRYTKTTD